MACVMPIRDERALGQPILVREVNGEFGSKISFINLLRLSKHTNKASVTDETLDSRLSQ